MICAKHSKNTFTKKPAKCDSDLHTKGSVPPCNKLLFLVIAAIVAYDHLRDIKYPS